MDERNNGNMTPEDRLKMIIGELHFAIVNLQSQLAEANKKLEKNE